MENVLAELYRTLTGEMPTAVKPMMGAGSNRRYFRVEGNHLTCVGVEGTSADENRAFVTLAKHFAGKQLAVPQVYAVSKDELYYLQEDLGDVLLFDAIAKGRASHSFSETECQLLRKVLQMLPDFQFRGAEGLDFSVCYPQSCFDKRLVMWDLNYFKYCFLKASGIEFREDKLENDFERMASVLIDDSCRSFMIRDFQSRNIMLRNNEPILIDFQGGRRGPFYYDVASFLWQAAAHYPQTLRYELLDIYWQNLQKYETVDKEIFISKLRYFVLFRTLQVLGAYGFRGYFERKSHFLMSVPPAIANLRDLLDGDFLEFPYLTTILREMVSLKRFDEPLPITELEVEISSFSYKKGIPEDLSGNGGGFVFDCRAVHNPGRYDQYKSMTGLDQPVIDFLEENGEILSFLTHVYALVDAAVERYIKRGFTHLAVHFGCTGGRHRSVYAAQHLTLHLHEKYGVRINLTHREQNIHQIYSSK